MPEGTIKKIVADRGFGFIASEDGKEYFFHRSAIDNFDSLRGGERVSFDTEPSPKGPRAAPRQPQRASRLSLNSCETQIWRGRSVATAPDLLTRSTT